MSDNWQAVDYVPAVSQGLYIQKPVLSPGSAGQSVSLILSHLRIDPLCPKNNDTDPNSGNRASLHRAMAG